MLFTGLGRSVLGKTLPEVSSTRAVLETSGTVFPNTDRPRPVNNIYFFFKTEQGPRSKFLSGGLNKTKFFLCGEGGGGDA